MGNDLCVNYLSSGHFIKCRSLHWHRKGQKPHHTLLHGDIQNNTSPNSHSLSQVSSNAAVKLKSGTLLMSYHVLDTAPDGSAVEVRALLDNASSASFVSEQASSELLSPHSNQNVQVSCRSVTQDFNPVYFQFQQSSMLEGRSTLLLSLSPK